MIRKHFTNPFKKWVKQKLDYIYKENDSGNEKKINPTKLLYYPYLNNSDSYVILKEKDELERCENDLPVPPKNLWLGYGSNSADYLYSGNEQITKMLELINETGFNFYKSKKILELGCSSGRMIRWLEPYSEGKEIWGTDISSEHIYWANKYLNPPFNFATTTTIPYLPFEDRYFDVIYAGSVFTHIDDLAISWLLELKRILSDKGIIYLTIHDKHSIKLLNEHNSWKDSKLTKRINSDILFNENKDKFSVFVNGRGVDSQVFYDLDYFCELVKSIFKVASVHEEAYGYQTAVLLEKIN